MRILAVTPYYAPEGGGLERYAHAILRRLAVDNDVQAIALTRQGLASGTQDGVAVQRIPARWRLGNAPLDLRFMREVNGVVRAWRPDVILGHTPVPFAAEVAHLAARRAGIPFVLTYHAGRLSGSSRLLATLAAVHRVSLERWMLDGASGLIAVSPYVRDNALHRHAGRAHVVAPGIDPARFPEAPFSIGRGILFVGPLSHSYGWKGLDVLLEAVGRLERRWPRLALTLVGDGERRDELQKRAEARPGSLILPGRLSDAALVDAYRAAAVVVLPSTSEAEAFGMVLAEANACGRPVVASRIGGIPDFVTDGENGLLARAGDARDLAAKLAIVLGDDAYARSLGAAGRRRVLRDHDWDALAARTQGILERAVSRRD